MKRATRRAVLVLTIAAETVVALASGGGCVDGTTPDCSGSEAGCAPNLDGSLLPDVASDGAHGDGAPGDAGPTDAGEAGDAPSDARLDGDAAG